MTNPSAGHYNLFRLSQPEKPKPIFYDHQDCLELLERLGDFPFQNWSFQWRIFAGRLARMRMPTSRGETPEKWSDARRRQEDAQARWTKKHGEKHYGHKNHISIDNKHEVIIHYAVTSAEVHDSQAL